MKMAEEFDRCSKCGGGWFEQKELFLIQKGSPRDREPVTYTKQINLQCVTCGNAQYKYTAE